MNFSGIMEDLVTLASEDKVEFDDDTLRGEKPTEDIKGVARGGVLGCP